MAAMFAAEITETSEASEASEAAEITETTEAVAALEKIAEILEAMQKDKSFCRNEAKVAERARDITKLVLSPPLEAHRRTEVTHKKTFMGRPAYYVFSLMYHEKGGVTFTYKDPETKTNVLETRTRKHLLVLPQGGGVAQSEVSMKGWDGSVPGDWERYTSNGWFDFTIQMIRKLQQQIIS